MREFWKQMIHGLEEGQPVCLVSLLESAGSTPRGAGVMMAVFPDGRIAGTIGGGNVEFEAQHLAAEVLRTGENLTRAYRFVQGDERALGMICGGDVTVHFQYLAGGDEEHGAIFHALTEADAQGKDTWLLMCLDGDTVTAMGLAHRDGAQFPGAPESIASLLTDQAVLTQGNPRWFSIPVVKAGRAYLFGAGHVSRALAEVLHTVGFRCVVVDDRAEFADPAHFPHAEQVLQCNFGSFQLPIGPDDFVVIMTRGHQADYEVLTQTLRSGARYLGCIGSRRKLALCRDRLLAAGFTAEEYQVLHAPIGLAIGAQTPEEIAVSVAAEMIAVRAGVSV